MLLGFKIFFMVYKLGLKKKEPKQCLKLSEEEMMQNIHLLGRRTELMQRAARPGHHSGLQPLLSECLTQLQQDSVYCRHSSCTLQVAFCYSCTWNWFTKKPCRSQCLKKGRKRRKKEGIKWAGFCVSVLLSDNTSSENSKRLGRMQTVRSQTDTGREDASASATSPWHLLRSAAVVPTALGWADILCSLPFTRMEIP